MDARFTSNPSFAGATLAYDGNRLPRAPRVKWSAFAEVRGSILGGEFLGRANYSFSDDFFYNPANDPASLQESFATLGAYGSWESADGLRISVTGENLLNERYSVHNISFQGLGFRLYAPPRAVTLTVRQTF